MDDSERKAQIREVFNTIADGYDRPALRFFPVSALHLSQYLNPADNAHILDVATGTGSVALTIANEIPTGHVTGIDLSEGMLAKASAKAAEQDITNVTFNLMDMTNIQYPDNHFDAASCGFGIFFLEDMHNCLCHIRNKVKPGGKLALCSFYETAFSPLVDLFFKRLLQFGVEPPPVSWKRLSHENDHTELHQAANLTDIQVYTEDIGYYLNDAKGWWEILWNAGYRGLLNQLTENDLQRFRDEHLAEVQTTASDEGIWLEVKAIYSVSTKN